MKNNILLLLSLVCCTQFATAMESSSSSRSSSSSEEDINDHGIPQRDGRDKRTEHSKIKRNGPLPKQKYGRRRISFNMTEKDRAYALLHSEIHPVPKFVPRNPNVRRNLFQEFN